MGLAERLGVVCVAFLLIGVMAVDLAFDVAESPAVRFYYYRHQLPGPIITLLVPSCMATAAGCMIRRLVTEGGAAAWASLVIFFSAGPYFELVVKPAEQALVNFNSRRLDETFEATHAVVLRGHLLLVAVLAVLVGLNLSGITGAAVAKMD